MLRESLIEHHKPRGFRWRGKEISRIEGLSDAVFAFAVTLLVVSLEVPKTFTELTALMSGFLPFAICFAMLMQVWHEQFIFSAAIICRTASASYSTVVCCSWCCSTFIR